MDTMKFTLLNENLQFKEGDPIAVFKINGSDQEYIIYSVEDYERNESKVLISYLIRDNDGIDHIRTIENLEERKKVINIFKDIIQGGLNHE